MSIRTYPLSDLPTFSDEEDRSRSTDKASSTDVLSPRILVQPLDDDRGERPAPISHLSAPAAPHQFPSPIRQHKRTPSVHREVKETLNAHSEYTSDDNDGPSQHRINQYFIKEEIGRGSYGAVHLGTDQFGNEYAIKEFSKARLRKRVQSNILRHGPRRLRAGFGAPDTPNARLSSQAAEEAKDALYFIREEVAIMKKLNHPNLVQLIEVLDDPEEDSLYMVLEMCKKGVIMKVGLDETADPYPEESCRCWFRDLILGIEYLHAQGVVHRDIKPDNLLLTDDDVLKVVDFGVSEMFEKASDMKTAKSAGSPAFLPPELCVAKHGDISGKAADIWSMGVTLYCLRYGRIPFERAGVLDMYEAIKTESPKIPPDENEQFVDLINRLMEKDPVKRIKMEALREHPWVTKGGEDPLLSTEENCEEDIVLINDLEVNHAFTRRVGHLLSVMKAISKFKSLLGRKGAAASPRDPVSKLDEDSDATPRAGNGLTEAEMSAAEHAARVLEERERFLKKLKTPSNGSTIPSEKGQAQNPTNTEPLVLGIGTGGGNDFSRGNEPADIVSDSPTAADFNIYDRAFGAEVDRIKRSTSRKGSRKGSDTLYHTKHLQGKEKYKTDGSLSWDEGSRSGLPSQSAPYRTSKFIDVVAQSMAKVEEVAKEAADEAGARIKGGTAELN